MALEAVGTVSNIAGLVSLGFSVCSGICKYYGKAVVVCLDLILDYEKLTEDCI